MKKLNKFTYEVSLHENVTIEVTSVQVNPNFFAASLDGTDLTSPPGPTLIYKFTVIKAPPLTHFVMVEASFTGAPDTARFDLQVSGSNGGSFKLSIAKTAGVHDPVIRFRVV